MSVIFSLDLTPWLNLYWPGYLPFISQYIPFYSTLYYCYYDVEYYLQLFKLSRYYNKILPIDKVRHPRDCSHWVSHKSPFWFKRPYLRSTTLQVQLTNRIDYIYLEWMNITQPGSAPQYSHLTPMERDGHHKNPSQNWLITTLFVWFFTKISTLKYTTRLTLKPLGFGFSTLWCCLYRSQVLAMQTIVNF